MVRSAFSPALLSAVIAAGDALQSAGTDARSAFVVSALSYDAARHASPAVPSREIIAANAARPVVAGVPSYTSASSVDCHALTGAALQHGYDDTTDPYALQSAVIAAVQDTGMKVARKVLRSEHDSAADALDALRDAAKVARKAAKDAASDDTGDTGDDTGDTGETTDTASRVSTGLGLILDALNDGETMTDTERATFLAIFETLTMSDALSA